MAKKLTLMLVGILVLTLVSVSVLAEEPVKFSLTMTDGGIGFLSWCKTVSIFPFDPAEEERGEEPIATVDSPSDPVEFSLPEGDYEIVISILGFRVDSKNEELFVIPFGHIELYQDMIYDIREAEVSPDVVPPFIPSALLRDEPRQEY